MTVRKRARMARKKRESSGPKRIVMSVISTLMLAGMIYLLFFTGIFELKEVQLHGGRYLPMDSLETVARDYIGANMLAVSFGDLRLNLERFPEVGKATFRRRPFHRIDCYLQERVPVALLSLDTIVGVDEEGVLLPCRDGKHWDLDLPLITGIDAEEIDSEGGSELVARSLEVLRLLKEFGFSTAEELSEIHVEDGNIVLVWMDEGALIQFGKRDYLDRVRKLRAVYAALGEDGEFPEFIDLRFERQVVIR